MRSLLFVLLAIILTYIGQILLRPGFISLEMQSNLNLGSLLLVLGMLLFGKFSSKLKNFGSERDDFGRNRESFLLKTLKSNRKSFFLIICISLFALCLILFSNYGETVFVLSLWIISIIFLLLAFINPLTIFLKLGNIFLKPSYSTFLMIVLIGIAFLLRIYQLTILPLNFDGDYASHGLQARKIAIGDQTDIFAFGWANIPMIGFLPSVLTMKLFGTGLLGLNMAAVIEGTLIIIGTYLLGKELLNSRVGLIAASFLTLSYVHIHFSRTSEYIDPIFFLVFAIYFLILGIKRRADYNFVLSGIFSGLCFLMYYSGRVILPIAAIFFLYVALFHRIIFLQKRRAFFLFLFSFFITLGPYLELFFNNLSGFMERTNNVFLFDKLVLEHLSTFYNTETLSGILSEQLKRTLLMFNYYFDSSTQSGIQAPFFDVITAPLIVLGLGYVLFTWRRLSSGVMLIWFGFILFTGSFLTNNPPFWPRLLGLLIPGVLFAAVVGEIVYLYIIRLIPKRHEVQSNRLLILIFIVFLSALGFNNWNTFIKNARDRASPRTQIARYLMSLDQDLDFYLVSNEYSYNDREFEFLLNKGFIRNLTRDDFRNPKLLLPSRSRVVFHNPNPDSRNLQLFKNLFPESWEDRFPQQVLKYNDFKVFVIR